MAAFQLSASIQLLDTGGMWPVQAGGSMAINSGPRSRARAWSRAIYRAYPAADGLLYPSSLTNLSCVALYERASHALPADPMFNEPLANGKLLSGLTLPAKKLRYAMS